MQCPTTCGRFPDAHDQRRCHAFKLNGGSTETFVGAIYVPKAAITYAGGANNNNGCTQIVADTVDFAGNANLAVNCTGVGTTAIGSATASLVE